MDKGIIVKIFRYNPASDVRPRYESFEVPVEEQTSVRTLLKYVKENLDPILAFRDHICYKGTCTTCLVRVDGKNVKACSTRVDVGQSIVVEPASGYPIIRDLVVDFGITTEDDEASYVIRKGALVQVRIKSE